MKSNWITEHNNLGIEWLGWCSLNPIEYLVVLQTVMYTIDIINNRNGRGQISRTFTWFIPVVIESGGQVISRQPIRPASKNPQKGVFIIRIREKTALILSFSLIIIIIITITINHFGVWNESLDHYHWIGYESLLIVDFHLLLATLGRCFRNPNGRIDPFRSKLYWQTHAAPICLNALSLSLSLLCSCWRCIEMSAALHQHPA